MNRYSPDHFSEAEAHDACEQARRSPYAWQEDMGYLSDGHDDDAELGYRAMVRVGAEWLDRNPGAVLDFEAHTPFHLPPAPVTDEARDLIHAMVDAANTESAHRADVLMLRLCLAHVLYIRDHGWLAFCSQRRSESGY